MFDFDPELQGGGVGVGGWLRLAARGGGSSGFRCGEVTWSGEFLRLDHSRGAFCLDVPIKTTKSSSLLAGEQKATESRVAFAESRKTVCKLV